MAFNSPVPERGERGKRSGVVSAIIQAEKLGQIALILPCAAFIGWLGGAWIGSKVHQVWPEAVGVVFGGAAGLYYVIRMAMDAMKDSANADGEDGPKGPADGSLDEGIGKGNGNWKR